MSPSLGRPAAALGLATGVVLVAACTADAAHAQGAHGGHSPAALQGLATGLAHGAAQAGAVFLAGLATFVALVWLPAVRAGDDGQVVGAGAFARWSWGLVGLLAVAGVAELSLYAVRASGEAFGVGLFGQALFETRVGHVWLARLGLGLLAAFAATRAARTGRPGYWWAAGVVGAVLLLTLTRVSHAAAEQRLLPSLADWAHASAASVWMGGLLGFAVALLGPLRAVPADRRAKLRRRAVRRFSRVATVAVMVLVVTGLYAVWLHVPGVAALVGTPYGRALALKLGLLVVLFAAGATNLRLGGREPFGRVLAGELLLAAGVFVATGFLTSLPPPGP